MATGEKVNLKLNPVIEKKIIDLEDHQMYMKITKDQVEMLKQIRITFDR